MGYLIIYNFIMKKLNSLNFRFISLFWLVLFFALLQIQPSTAQSDIPEPVTINNQNEEASPSEIVYTVVPGDSLSRIANKYRINLWQLKSWNKLGDNTFLKPGQQLTIKHIEYPAVEGLASWYGPGFHGQHMANTEIYNMYDIVVAHRTLPLGTKVKVTNLENGRSIIAPVLDRGPYVTDAAGNYTREIDLSYAVAEELGTIQRGVVRARIEPINEPLALK